MEKERKSPKLNESNKKIMIYSAIVLAVVLSIFLAINALDIQGQRPDDVDRDSTENRSYGDHLSQNQEDLIGYIESNNSGNIRDLAEELDDIDYLDFEGNTPLIIASTYGFSHTAQILLDEGADINHQNDQGETALILAAHSGQKEVVRTLLENGADSSIETNEGETALERAESSEIEEVLEEYN